MVEVSIYFYLKRGTKTLLSFSIDDLFQLIAGATNILETNSTLWKTLKRYVTLSFLGIVLCKMKTENTPCHQFANSGDGAEKQESSRVTYWVSFIRQDQSKYQEKAKIIETVVNIPSQQYYSVNVTAILLEYFMLRGNVITTVSINLSFLMIFIFWSCVV